MVVTKRVLLTALLSLIYCEGLIAKVTNKVKIIYNTLDQKGSGGTQIIDNSGDQDLVVSEPMIFAQVGIDDNFSLNAMGSNDSWTSASDKAFDDATSASLVKSQERKSYSLGFNFDNKVSGAYLNFGSSEEDDYESKSISIGGLKTFAEDNFSLGLNYSQYDDQTRLWDVLADEEKSFEDKKVKSYSIDMSQILTRTDLMLFGYNYITQEGTLEGSLNTIDLAGIRQEEILPKAKYRNAYYIKFIHSLKEDQALHFSYRLYDDSWNIKANTFELNWLKSYFDSDAFIEIFYRYYSQTELSYYKKSFSNEKKYMTSDADYQKFESHQVGFFYNKDFEIMDLDSNFVLGYTHYTRSNDLEYDTVQVSVGVEF